ncbi:hypothetical protein HDU76_002530 [Blyttiomyces sp. JEL0837]|nr:hypothetical protein HDU76_002530 [Blyttiomyces sp. JEL0837]
MVKAEEQVNEVGANNITPDTIDSEQDDESAKLKAAQQEAFRTKFYNESTDMRKYWYPLALSTDVKTTEPKSIQLLDDPLVMYRDPETREAIVLADKCPHRSAPLSTGRIMDGRLECRYHGWSFDTEGQCVRVPSLMPGKTIPANARIRKYPTFEEDGIVWVWPGSIEDCEKAEKPKPYFPCGDDLTVKPRFGYIDLDIDHCLLVENFLDPAHLPFTHDGSISKRSNATALSMSCEFVETGLIGFQHLPEKPDDNAIRQTEFRPPICVAIKFHKGSYIMDQTFYPVPTKKGHCRFFWFARFGFLSFMESNFLTRWYLDYYFPKNTLKVVMEDYAMLIGQQKRLEKGANAMNSPVAADLLIKVYRNWWRKAMRRNGGPYFKGYSTDIEDIVLNDCKRTCGGSHSDKKSLDDDNDDETLDE